SAMAAAPQVHHPAAMPRGRSTTAASVTAKRTRVRRVRKEVNATRSLVGAVLDLARAPPRPPPREDWPPPAARAMSGSSSFDATPRHPTLLPRALPSPVVAEEGRAADRRARVRARCARRRGRGNPRRHGTAGSELHPRPRADARLRGSHRRHRARQAALHRPEAVLHPRLHRGALVLPPPPRSPP